MKKTQTLTTFRTIEGNCNKTDKIKCKLTTENKRTKGKNKRKK